MSQPLEEYIKSVRSFLDKAGYLFMLDDQATDAIIADAHTAGETAKECAEGFIGIEIEEDEDNEIEEEDEEPSESEYFRRERYRDDRNMDDNKV